MRRKNKELKIDAALLPSAGRGEWAAFHINQKWVCCTHSMAEAIRETLYVTITTIKPVHPQQQPKHNTQCKLLGYLVSLLKQAVLDLAAVRGGLINCSLQQQRLGSS